MPIILRANQLNSLIYKYLLESGLSHAAYTLFNEAALAQPLQEFRFDIRPGHLLSLLEKGMVYAQIESHVSLSEYLQCNQPFYLLKSHTCNVVEKVRKEKEQLLQQLGDQINDSIKRTNCAYSSAIANRNYDDILYDAKGVKYFEKFPKIKLPPSESDKSQQYILKGTDQSSLLYNVDEFQIDLLRYDVLNDEIVIDRIFPCVSEGKLQSPINFVCTAEHLVQLYRNNKVTVFKLCNDNLEPIQFMLGGESEAFSMLPNPNITQLITINGHHQFWILNLNTFKLVSHGTGIFAWKEYDQYFVVQDNTVKIFSLCSNEVLFSYATEHSWEQISLNPQKNFYSLINSTQRLIYIYTFQKSEPLFIFDFSSEGPLKQTLWINSNNVDYFCLLTDTQIKIFDISLNTYSKVIDISEYDAQVSKLGLLKKTDKDEYFLVALGTQNIIIYDVTNAKIERIEITGKEPQMYILNTEKLALIMENCIYYLVPQYIEPLFN